jgi:hypothetical protein
MIHKLLCAVGLIVLGIVSFLAAPVNAETFANGPYYATPSWDQKLTCDGISNCPRFVVLSNWNNEAVLDRETGLVWERSPASEIFNWNDALYHCVGLAAGNRMGWRLPTVQELLSLIDTTVVSFPRLPPGHPFIISFPGSGSHGFWSATLKLSDPAYAYLVGNTAVGFTKALSHYDWIDFHAWCVRGGQGLEQQ